MQTYRADYQHPLYPAYTVVEPPQGSENLNQPTTSDPHPPEEIEPTVEPVRTVTLAICSIMKVLIF